NGHQLTIITRSPEKYQKYESDNRHFVEWKSDISGIISGSDAVINLAGENLFDQRWTIEVKKSIRNSRVKVTASVVKGIKKAKSKPKVLLSASAVGYYGDRKNAKIVEDTPAGDDFLANVCDEWEHAASKAKEYGVRVVIPRIGIPLEKDGGALSQMLTPFEYFVGGPLGNGQQYFPWIHMTDLCRAFLFALEHDDFEGPFNVTAPNPVTMKKFAKALGTALNRPSLFWVPEIVLKIVMGEAADSVTSSLRVIPKKLLDHGFTFSYPNVIPALIDILT
ncbi:MAG TPA: TIGR01777 family oxidoreductase, partial [Balneolales bacterium]|nr:TIGR01777 family oxidoreductase [Balneolales bacterium]